MGGILVLGSFRISVTGNGPGGGLVTDTGGGWMSL